MDMVKKNTIQEMGFGLNFSELCGFGGFSFDSLADCFSCFFLNFLANYRKPLD